MKVKRYANRKLYVTDLSRYTSSSEVLTWVREFKDVVVVDVTSGRDITVKVLLSAMAECSDLSVDRVLALCRFPNKG